MSSSRFFPLMIIATLAASLTMTACGDDNGDNGDNANGHEDASGMEIQTRGPASEVIAKWNLDDGWTDADGNEIDELPPSVDRDGQPDIEPLREDGPNASLTLRIFDRNGDPVDMDTIERHDDTGERECTEYSARYAPMDHETDILAWNPYSGSETGVVPFQHPDTDMDPQDAPFQFAETEDGEIIALFHCDHIHLYPENEGTVDVEFLLWHLNHSDDHSDPLTVRVEEAEDE